MVGAILGGAQMLGGAIQGYIGTRRANRAEKGLENLATPQAQANSSLNNYMASANANPYDSAMFKMQQQNIARNGVGALRNAQDRGDALGVVGNIVRGQNDATLKNAATAEQVQDSKLRAATGLKIQEDNRLFDINKMLPYQKKYMLLAQKAAGGNAMANAGWRNLFGGAQTAGMDLGQDKQNYSTVTA